MSEPDLEKLKETEIPTRRAKMLMINPADFMVLFTKGIVFKKHTRVIEGIPEDAKLIGLAAEPVRNGVILVVESDTYDEIPINVMPPIEVVSINMGLKGATKKKRK